jgi:hypothetical protein
VADARILDDGLGDIISVASAIFDCMSRREPITAFIVKEAHQQTWHSGSLAVSVGILVGLQLRLHLVPQFTGDYSFDLTGLN